MQKYQSARILSRVNIVDIIKTYLPLEKRGENYRAKCPFHTDNDPSFSVSPRLGIFKCFGVGCEASGNVANFVALYDNITYTQALAKLAEEIGRPDLAPQARTIEFGDVLEINELVLNLYQKALFTKSDVSQRARMNLRERRITQETAKLFGLGYSPNSWTWLVDQNLNMEGLNKAGLISKTDAGHYRDFFKNRIIFPLFSNKKLIGFTGRTLGISRKIPKYLNSKDSPLFKKSKMLYGWELNRGDIRRQKDVVIVEGQFDVLQLYQRGIKNTVAVSGSYFGYDQAAILSKVAKEATFFCDGDEAGVNAAIRVGEYLLASNVKTKIIYVEGKDPDECAKYKHRFDWEQLNSKYCSSYTEFTFNHTGLETTLKRIASYKNKIQLSYALKELSDLSGYDEKNLEHWLKEYKRAPLEATVINPEKTQLRLNEELLLLAAMNGSVDLNGYLKKKLKPDFLELINNKTEGFVQELANNPRYARRLHMLEYLKDKEKYTKDLIVKMNLNFMQKDVKKYKELYKETGDSKHLSNLETMVKRINKLKIKVRHGKSYQSTYNESNSPSV